MLDNCPKGKGMQMLLRTMSPQVIAVDELGRRDEFEAVQEILYSGCHLLATVHAGSIDELYEKPFMAELLETGQIERLVQIRRDDMGKRSYHVFDKKLQALC